MAEKGTKYFHSRAGNERRNWFRAMELENTRPGEITDRTDEMLNECVKYYSEMYTHAENTERNINTFLRDLPVLDENERRICDAPITARELEETLKQMRGGSSPGLDGITTCFLKTFWAELKDLILNVVEEIEENGVIPKQMQISVTTLIPKKRKRKTIC